jgi:hypothetical protein
LQCVCHMNIIGNYPKFFINFKMIIHGPFFD